MSDTFTTRRRMMVDTQVRPSDVTKYPIIEAMLAVPREDFVPTDLREAAYLGENLELGEGRVILEPRTLAKLLDALSPGADDTALVVGAALGYSAALLGRLCAAVIALEDNEEWAGDAESSLAAASADNVAIVTGPLAEGAVKHAPYDLILVEGGVGQLPDDLCKQLAPGGRIACLLMEGSLGKAMIGTRIGDRTGWHFEFNAAAPLLPDFTAEPSFSL